MLKLAKLKFFALYAKYEEVQKEVMEDYKYSTIGAAIIIALCKIQDDIARLIKILSMAIYNEWISNEMGMYVLNKIVKFNNSELLATWGGIAAIVFGLHFIIETYKVKRKI